MILYNLWDCLMPLLQTINCVVCVACQFIGNLWDSSAILADPQTMYIKVESTYFM